MSRNSAFIFLFAALFMVAHGSQFQRFALDQGRVNFRGLDTAPAAATDRNVLGNHTYNTGVEVSLGENYTTKAEIYQNQTDMALFLYTNITGFCRDCSEFKNYKCNSNDCNASTTDGRKFIAANYYVREGYELNQTVTIGKKDSTVNWNLSTPAFLFTSGPRWTYSVYKGAQSRNYLADYTTGNVTYGFIGLGVDGNAANNFKGDHPLFSIQINGTGQGQLIFGKDTTLYTASRTPITLTTNGNWTAHSTNFTLGALNNNTEFSSEVIFDLQYPGIALPDSIWGATMAKMIIQFNVTSSANTTESDGYNYVYKGAVTDLPPLKLGLTNGQIISIPSVAYTKKIADNFYAIEIGYYNKNNDVNFTILGASVLSQYYTVFESPKGGQPTVTLYPTYDASLDSATGASTSSTSFGGRLFQIAVIAVILAVVYMFFKNKAAAKLKTELGVELRDGQPY